MYGVSRIRIEYISCESRTDYDICVPNIVLQSTWYMIGRVRWIEWRLPSGWWPHTFMQQIRFSVLRLNQNGGILPWEKSRRMIFFHLLCINNHRPVQMDRIREEWRRPSSKTKRVQWNALTLMTSILAWLPVPSQLFHAFFCHLFWVPRIRSCIAQAAA